jgi:energy-coupling factor transporter ATP-binding protein EcfA2
MESLSGIDPQLIGRLESFCAFTMAHPRLLAARDQLMDAVDGAAPGSLVMLLGPTGVGKTTLRMKAEQLLAQQMGQVLAADRGRLPFVSVEVMAPENGRFRWKDYFSRFLMAMAEPVINGKLIRSPYLLNGDLPENIPEIATCSSSDLEYAIERALQYRRPPVVFIDEAQHLARIASGRKLSDQLDVIKSIANRTKIVHVLLGTYELLAFRNLSGQLSRRSVDLHFARYSADSSEDRQIFKNILLTFQKQLPFAEEPDLLDRWEFLYERSVGCVGILKEWLVRASIASLKHGDVTLLLKDLEQTALSVSQCEKILLESREGEARLNDNEDSRSRLQTLLGIGSSTVQRDERACVQTSTTKSRQVGQRRPQRDPIESAVSACG